MEIALVVLVIAVFLFHLRSALVAAITLPVATASTFIAFYYLDLTINIMSLAGVILALGDMVDSACVLVENAHKEIEAAEQGGARTSRMEVVLKSARDLGPSMFGALLVLTIAFLPVAFGRRSPLSRITPFRRSSLVRGWMDHRSRPTRAASSSAVRPAVPASRIAISATR